MATTTSVQYRETSVKPAPRRFSTKHLMLFFIFTIVTIAMLILLPQFFWVCLPFVLTYIVQAFDAL